MRERRLRSFLRCQHSWTVPLAAASLQKRRLHPPSALPPWLRPLVSTPAVRARLEHYGYTCVNRAAPTPRAPQGSADSGACETTEGKAAPRGERPREEVGRSALRKQRPWKEAPSGRNTLMKKRPHTGRSAPMAHTEPLRSAALGAPVAGVAPHRPPRFLEPAPTTFPRARVGSLAAGMGPPPATFPRAKLSVSGAAVFSGAHPLLGATL